MESQESSDTARKESPVLEALQNLAVSVVIALVTWLLVVVFTYLNIQNPLVSMTAAVIVVITFAVLFGMKSQRHVSFWFLAALALALTVGLLSFTILRVPNAVGKELSEAKQILVDAGLNFEEAEMVKGGSQEVIQQRPEAGERVFPGSYVKLFYGGRPVIRITSPRSGDEVDSHLIDVLGSVQGADSAGSYVYLLVRSPDNHVWVQDPPDRKPNGEFVVKARLGTPELGRGDTFRLQAIVTTDPLKVGDFGLDLPRAIALSENVEITRKR